ncbi:Callose synthase 7 [Camellia lanceoleosa]|uniref:Callose synthase 7 n=1 Tax=Camellia lanceoleosa TaxID=1840588 RepID=A0ACC0HSJ6_9ERIC|nr:Callose synthase 7 [Camellia lanceoleosa]
MQRGTFKQIWSRNNDNALDVSHVGIQIPISNELDTNESEVRAPNIVPPTSSRAHPPDVDKEYEIRYRKYLSSKLARLVTRRRLLLTRYDRNDPTLKDRLRKIEKENRHLRITVLRLKRMQRGTFKQIWSRNNDNALDVSHVGIQIPISNELDTNESEVRAPNIVPPTSSRAHPPVSMMCRARCMQDKCMDAHMHSISVLTPYYNEDVLYSEEELKKENEDGITTLFYLQKIYGAQKKSSEARDRSCYSNILNLMYPSLRVAYIDEREEPVDGKRGKNYYSVLVKGGEKLDEEIYRIKLPGPPTEIGEGKPENQNHDIIFTRGEALQTIDMNQDNYLEEAFKMRNVLEELLKTHHGRRKPTILDLREHIFTGRLGYHCFITRLVYVQLGDKFCDHWPTNFGEPSKRILEDAAIRQSKALEEALATHSVFQLGLLLVLPMVMEIGLERGFRTALGDFVIMQLQLASIFFTFHS